MLYDVFISYASEDRIDFVRPLADALKAQRVELWYDEFSLKAGDSLNASINQGLAKSRYGIVVLSPAFFRKRWPEWELNGLVQRHLSGTEQVIIPVWHQLGSEEVAKFSPSLADIVALNTTSGLGAVVAGILKRLRPEGSTLIVARDFVLSKGAEPPVVTDDWWLDILEDSNAIEQDRRWRLPLWQILPADTSRGERLGWLALQQGWHVAAVEQQINQTTQPERVLKFIAEQPGLEDLIRMAPRHLLDVAPQLVIRGFGGRFEPLIEEIYQKSVREGAARLARNDSYGSAVTTDGKTPPCDGNVALRHPTFGNQDAASLACDFVQGPGMGTDIKVYEAIDYIAWIMSSASDWLPQGHKTILTQGMKEWTVWLWFDEYFDRNPNFERGADSGALAGQLMAAGTFRAFRLTAAAKRDLLHRLEASRQLLGLPESAAVLRQRFIDLGFIEEYLARQSKRKKRRKKAKSRKRS